MLFRLETVQPGKKTTRDLDLDEAQLELVSGRATAKDIHAEFQFQIDPLGYAVKYKVKAEVETACVRCAGSLGYGIEAQDWISLRTQHPGEANVILDGSEMSIRFIEDEVINLDDFTLECIEMELPDYPRHEENNPECVAPDDSSESENDSPFNVLSKFLD